MEKTVSNHIDNEIREILKAQTARCVAAAKIELDRVCLTNSSIGQQIINAIAKCGEFGHE